MPSAKISSGLYKEPCGIQAPVGRLLMALGYRRIVRYAPVGEDTYGEEDRPAA